MGVGECGSSTPAIEAVMHVLSSHPGPSYTESRSQNPIAVLDTRAFANSSGLIPRASSSGVCLPRAVRHILLQPQTQYFVVEELAKAPGFAGQMPVHRGAVDNGHTGLRRQENASLQSSTLAGRCLLASRAYGAPRLSSNCAQRAGVSRGSSRVILGADPTR